MVEIPIPNKEEIDLAIKAEEFTDREVWILSKFGGDLE